MVMALNADGPSLPLGYLRQAAVLLGEKDVVFGEGDDGGYYLVGMKRLHPMLFHEIPWSTGDVLAQSLERAVEAGLSVGVTPTWYDIDTIQDLQRLINELDRLPADQLIHTRRFLVESGFLD
jgi:glycosyltransferase A (GT-A) superfamily protein (DUF2064 family)